MKSFINRVDHLVLRYLPDPFVIALLLTLFVYAMAYLTTEFSTYYLSVYWFDNFWKLLQFTLQMALILATGYALSQAPIFQKLLSLLAGLMNTYSKAIVGITLIAGIASLINWGFGLVIGAIVAKKLIQIYPHYNFKRLVASSYSGFILWHGGVSGSIPLAVNTPDNFSVKIIGHTLELSQTLLSPVNLTAIFGLLLILPLTNWLIARNDEQGSVVSNAENSKMDSSPPIDLKDRTLTNAFCLFALFGLLAFLMSKAPFHINLNSINFIFLFLGLFLHQSSRSYSKSFGEGVSKVSPILLQYPLYAGIMGIMSESGLARDISQLFIDLSGSESFAFLSFLSAGFINIFVPSGGGQWVVQGPIVIPAAQNLGVDLGLATMAVAWGDAWTNLLQPFWALPLLSIAGLSTKDIMGQLLVLLVVSGAFLSSLFLIFALL